MEAETLSCLRNQYTLTMSFVIFGLLWVSTYLYLLVKLSNKFEKFLYSFSIEYVFLSLKQNHV